MFVNVLDLKESLPCWLVRSFFLWLELFCCTRTYKVNKQLLQSILSTILSKLVKQFKRKTAQRTLTHRRKHSLTHPHTCIRPASRFQKLDWSEQKLNGICQTEVKWSNHNDLLKCYQDSQLTGFFK